MADTRPAIKQKGRRKRKSKLLQIKISSYSLLYIQIPPTPHSFRCWTFLIPRRTASRCRSAGLSLHGRRIDGLAEGRLAAVSQDGVVGVDLLGPEVDGDLVLGGIGDLLLQFLQRGRLLACICAEEE